MGKIRTVIKRWWNKERFQSRGSKQEGLEQLCLTCGQTSYHREYGTKVWRILMVLAAKFRPLSGKILLATTLKIDSSTDRSGSRDRLEIRKIKKIRDGYAILQCDLFDRTGHLHFRQWRIQKSWSKKVTNSRFFRLLINFPEALIKKPERVIFGWEHQKK